MLSDTSKVKAFESWYQEHRTTQVEGKRLEDWTDMAAGSGKLPNAVCGTGGEFTARTLHAQVYPGKPDPWNS